MSQYVWEDGTVTGSVNVEKLLAEHPDHPVSKQILADREAAASEPGAEPEAETAEPEEEDTVDSLKEQLRDRGLPVSGNKAELVERLREADSEGEEG